MADRHVTHTRKNGRGDIVALANPDEPWSPRFRDEAIADIANKVHRYYIQPPGGQPRFIEVVSGLRGKRLRTNGGNRHGRDLDALPDY